MPVEEKDVLKMKIKDVNFYCGSNELGRVYEGGCGKKLPILDAYRCSDCGVYFHRDCANKHFKKSSAEEMRKKVNMDTWEPEVRGAFKKGDVEQIIGIVFNLLDTK